MFFSMGKNNVVQRYVPCVMIDGDTKTFYEDRINRLIKSSNQFSAKGETIKVVSIVGAQNSGKSTLLNALFECHFDVLNAKKSIQQTTKGLWASDCLLPGLLVVDVEGSDGKERANIDDTSFERKSALFALVISDVMIFNLKAEDVGKNNAGGIPLFETIFQERVKLQQGQTRLLVVLRDYDTESMPPEETLKAQMTNSMEEIWNGVNNSVPFSNFIHVTVVTLPHFSYRRPDFNTKIGELRDMFVNNQIFDGFQHHQVTAEAFSFSTTKIWKDINENKHLDLPNHREMVSGYFCEKVKTQCIQSLNTDADYLSLTGNTIESTQEFSDKLGRLMKRLTNMYDPETKTYDERIMNEKKTQLKDYIIYSTITNFQFLIARKAQDICRDGIKSIYSVRKTNPTANVDEVIENRIRRFIDECAVLMQTYPSLPYQKLADSLKSDLDTQDKLQQEHYQKFQELTLANIKAQKEKEAAERKSEETIKQLAEAKSEAEKKRLQDENEKLRAEIERATAAVARSEMMAAKAKEEAENPPTFGLKFAKALGRALDIAINALQWT